MIVDLPPLSLIPRSNIKGLLEKILFVITSDNRDCTALPQTHAPEVRVIDFAQTTGSNALELLLYHIIPPTERTITAVEYTGQ